MAFGFGLRARLSRLRSGLFPGTDPGAATSYAGYLRRASSNPAIQALRARAKEHLHLQPGQVVADVGCGPGVVAGEFAQLVGATGHTMAIDRDPSMIADARRSGRSAPGPARPTYYIGDCAALPFHTAALDAYYCERVLQHMRDPAPSMAMIEAIRAVKPGGRLAVADTDWTTLSISSDERSLADRVAAAHHMRFPNPSAGARLEKWLLDAGADEVRVEYFVVTIASAAATGLLTSRDQSSFDGRVLSSSERRRWRSSLRRARAGGLPYGRLTMILATARRKIAIEP